MGMINEFREFAVKGNMMDMAVGIIIGGAFGKIISSLVKDVIMPPIGQMMGGVDFSNLFVDLSGGGYETLAAAQEAGAATLNYGSFLQTVLDFLIIALAVFMMVKGMNNMRKKEEAVEEPAAPPEPSDEAKLLAEIRDSLRRG